MHTNEVDFSLPVNLAIYTSLAALLDVQNNTKAYSNAIAVQLDRQGISIETDDAS